MESSNLPDELVGDPRLQGADKANHTDQILDRGFDIGGPIVKDKLWFWGSYGKQDIRIIRLTQTNDRTVLTNKNAKINWAATSKDQVSGFYFDGAKEKFGRSPGQASNEADSFLWNQGNFYPRRGRAAPRSTGCGRWRTTTSSATRCSSTRKYAYFGWGYGFAPRGGADQDGGIDYDADRAYRLLVYLHGPQALAHRRRQRQRLQERRRRHPRVQVRLRLPPQPEQLDHAVERQRGGGRQQWARQRRTRWRIARGSCRSPARTTTPSSATPSAMGRSP